MVDLITIFEHESNLELGKVKFPVVPQVGDRIKLNSNNLKFVVVAREIEEFDLNGFEGGIILWVSPLGEFWSEPVGVSTPEKKDDLAP